MAWALPGRGATTSTVYHRVIEPGARGIEVWALQRALNDIGRSGTLTLDGDYGPATERAVREFQSKTTGLEPDGVAGPLTQRKVVGILIDAREGAYGGPRGLLRGFAEGEGGWLIAPLNWSSAGGVDVGALQRRVYERDYGTDAVIERAFNARYQARLLADRVLELRGIFIARAGTNDGFNGMPAKEKAWRLAALNHNYPAGADRLSRTPINELSAYWTSDQDWVLYEDAPRNTKPRNYFFPDGARVRTPLDWCHLYAGVVAPAHRHRGSVTRYVTDWTQG